MSVSATKTFPEPPTLGLSDAKNDSQHLQRNCNGECIALAWSTAKTHDAHQARIRCAELNYISPGGVHHPQTDQNLPRSPIMPTARCSPKTGGEMKINDLTPLSVARQILFASFHNQHSRQRAKQHGIENHLTLKLAIRRTQFCASTIAWRVFSRAVHQ